MIPTRRLPLPYRPETSCVEVVSGPVWLRLERVGAATVLPRRTAPVLLYRFTPGRRMLGGVFQLLGPDAPPPAWDTPAEVLVAGCGDWRLAAGATDRRWRQDPGVRALAVELRRALIESPRPPEPYLEHLVRAMFLRAAAAASPEESVGGGLTGPRLERVMAAIDAGLRNRLTLDDLARAAGMSRARFAEAFRRTMGATPHAYVRTKRLEAVRSALESGEQDLARLAARFGFSSHAHMTTAFRSVFGMTPSAYRRAVAAEGRANGPAPQLTLPGVWELGGKAPAFAEQRP